MSKTPPYSQKIYPSSICAKCVNLNNCVMNGFASMNKTDCEAFKPKPDPQPSSSELFALGDRVEFYGKNRLHGGMITVALDTGGCLNKEELLSLNIRASDKQFIFTPRFGEVVLFRYGDIALEGMVTENGVKYGKYTVLFEQTEVLPYEYNAVGMKWSDIADASREAEDVVLSAKKYVANMFRPLPGVLQ